MKLNKGKIMLLLAEQALTMTALANKCGVSRQQISAIIGRGTCTPITANKLAKGLGVDVSEIIKEE